VREESRSYEKLYCKLASPMSISCRSKERVPLCKPTDKTSDNVTTVKRSNRAPRVFERPLLPK
jgi:hypothetical protein